MEYKGIYTDMEYKEIYTGKINLPDNVKTFKANERFLNIISSNEITDKFLTEKISIAKLMRISCQRTNSYIGFFHGEKFRFPFWKAKKFE